MCLLKEDCQKCPHVSLSNNFIPQVILKIIKHCQEENCSPETQGQLLGLVYDNRLEITNCFPLPRSNEDDETEDSMF